jgi:hypothetical protein
MWRRCASEIKEISSVFSSLQLCAADNVPTNHLSRIEVQGKFTVVHTSLDEAHIV